MARMLDVYLHEHLVGHLIPDDGGQIECLESRLAQPRAAAKRSSKMHNTSCVLAAPNSMGRRHPIRDSEEFE
jgi:hypothetical protein